MKAEGCSISESRVVPKYLLAVNLIDLYINGCKIIVKGDTAAMFAASHHLAKLVSRDVIMQMPSLFASQCLMQIYKSQCLRDDIFAQDHHLHPLHKLPDARGLTNVLYLRLYMES